MTGEGYALAREELVRTLTSYSGVTTSDGSSSKNTLIDNALTTVIKTSDNDFLTGKSILIMSGNARWETSGITSFNSSTGEITVATPFSAQIVAGVSFRVLNVLPESVHISSGEVQIMGYDYGSGEWRKIRVTSSGEMAIHITVTDIVTAKISGQSVVVTSGQVALASGTGPVLAKVSGETVIAKISGETHALASGTGPILAKVSGETVELQSGTGPILAKISGETLIAKVSGETVELASGTGPILAKVSGETVELQSGTGPILAKVSGETVSIETPTSIKTGPIRQLTDLSGGQVLHSGAIKSVLVKALTDNSGMIVVGGATDRPWYEAVCSGQGLVLDGAEAVSLDVDDFDAVYVVAEVSGDQVSFIGVN